MIACQEGWAPNPPAVMTEEQARKVLEQLAYIRREYADAVDALNQKIDDITARAREKMQIDFGEGNCIGLQAYAVTLEERLKSFALERMEVKTLKNGEHTLARRQNPDRVEINSDRLGDIQRAVSPLTARTLSRLSLGELLEDMRTDQHDIAKADWPDVRKWLEGLNDEQLETPLAGLFKFELRLDTAAIKAAIDNGTRRPGDLKRLGIDLIPGELRVDITTK